jgi:hypothetical protein
MEKADHFSFAGEAQSGPKFVSMHRILRRRQLTCESSRRNVIYT